MGKETTGDAYGNIHPLIEQMKQERRALKSRVLLARCGIQKEWEKAEAKWLLLNAPGIALPNDPRQLAQELKNTYIRIYQGLLAKSCLLLDQLNRIGQTDALTLRDLKRQVAAELATIRLRLEKLGGAESLHLPLEEEPVCACLECRQDRGQQPFNLE